MPDPNSHGREGDGPFDASSSSEPESRSSDGASSVVSDSRAEIERALGGYMTAERLDRLIDQILAIDKSAWGHCKGCGREVKVRVPDAKAVVSALGELLTQALGRPGLAGSDGGGEWVFVNRVVLAGEETA